MIRLAEAALAFARDRYPRLDAARYLGRLDDLAERIERLGASTPEDRADALRAVLCREERLSGNREDYYDPRNSYLNEVLDRRTGIPISLSAVWLDVAARLDWPFVGVGLPGHFVIAQLSPEGPSWIDPFGGGRPLDRDACGSLVEAALGPGTALAEVHLSPVGARAILTRMLDNLRSIYVQAGQWTQAAFVLSRLRALLPEEAAVRQDLAAVLQRVARLN